MIYENVKMCQIWQTYILYEMKYFNNVTVIRLFVMPDWESNNV